MRRALLLLILIFLLPGCASAGGGRGSADPAAGPPAEPPPPSREKRVPAVDRNDPLYSRVEGERFENRCLADSDCHAGGCSREVCSASEGIVTSCEARRWPQGRAACGCVDGECIWYRAEDEAGSRFLLEGQGGPCREGECPAGLKCVPHREPEGASRPRHRSCEIPCADPEAKCPEGQSCVTLEEGPGKVCRPRP